MLVSPRTSPFLRTTKETTKNARSVPRFLQIKWTCRGLLILRPSLLSCAITHRTLIIIGHEVELHPRRKSKRKGRKLEVSVNKVGLDQVLGSVRLCSFLKTRVMAGCVPVDPKSPPCDSPGSRNTFSVPWATIRFGAQEPVRARIVLSRVVCGEYSSEPKRRLRVACVAEKAW